LLTLFIWITRNS